MTRRGRPARLVSGALSEDAWSSQVAGLAAFYGWQGYHTHDSRRSPAGFPDWVFLRYDAPATELLVVELKPDKGTPRVTLAEATARPEWLAHRDLTNEQAGWLEAFRALEANVDGLVRYATGRGRVIPATSVEAHVWRPADFDVVERRLSAGRHRQPSIHKPA